MPVPLVSVPVWSQFVAAIEWGLRIIADNVGSAGLAVVIFTLLFKVIVLPLTIKGVRSTYGMQELQPKIKELQKKYGKDKQRLQAEQMKLYQEHGVNPMSGCLPMLLQMPIFFGLYFAIENLSRHGGGVWSQSFLWLPSLAVADPTHILPLVAGFFQFIQTRMTRPAHQGKSADPQQQMMNSMMMFMPLMVVVFGWKFSSGPVVYWVVSAMFSVVQQWFITGWGAMLDWFPFLPDLPEHRRLGYLTPAQRAAMAEKQKQNPGLFAKMSQKIQEQQAVASDANSDGSQDVEPPAARPAKSTKSRSGSGAKAPAKSQNGRAAASPPPIPRPDLVPRRERSSSGRSSGAAQAQPPSEAPRTDLVPRKAKAAKRNRSAESAEGD